MTDAAQWLSLQMGIIDKALSYRQEQIDKNQRYQLLLDQIALKERQAEDKRNNDLLGTLWKTATDEGTPPEVFQYFQKFADSYKTTMSPQQQTALDVTIARGLYSKEDRMVDEFQRIKGKRPQLPPEFELTPSTLQQGAEFKVAQTEYDYSLRAYLAGGKDKLSEDSAPSLVPVGTLGEGEEMRNIYAFRNEATGQVQTIDTRADIPGELYQAAKKGGFGPTMMERYDLIPFNPQGKVMIIGDKQYQVFSGVKLTDGTTNVIKIPLGERPSSQEGKTGRMPQPPQSARNIITLLQDQSDGEVDEKRAGAYYSWLREAKELDKISVKKEDLIEGFPKLGSDYGTTMVGFERKFNLQHPGWVVAPIYQKTEQKGFDFWLLDKASVYLQDPKWIMFPGQGERDFFINGVRQRAWYSEEIPGVGKHIWYNHFGQQLKDYDGVAPGTNVEE